MAQSDAQKRERRWLRQHMGYLRQAVTRELDVISKRISALEDLLSPVEDDWPPGHKDASSSLEHGDSEGSQGFCIACDVLMAAGRPRIIVEQIHALHIGD